MGSLGGPSTAADPPPNRSRCPPGGGIAKRKMQLRPHGQQRRRQSSTRRRLLVERHGRVRRYPVFLLAAMHIASVVLPGSSEDQDELVFQHQNRNSHNLRSPITSERPPGRSLRRSACLLPLLASVRIPPCSGGLNKKQFNIHNIKAQKETQLWRTRPPSPSSFPRSPPVTSSSFRS